MAIQTISTKEQKPRLFSQRQLKKWISDDQLSVKEKQQVDAIIKKSSF